MFWHRAGGLCLGWRGSGMLLRTGHTRQAAMPSLGHCREGRRQAEPALPTPAQYLPPVLSQSWGWGGHPLSPRAAPERNLRLQKNCSGHRSWDLGGRWIGGGLGMGWL